MPKFPTFWRARAPPIVAAFAAVRLGTTVFTRVPAAVALATRAAALSSAVMGLGFTFGEEAAVDFGL